MPETPQVGNRFALDHARLLIVDDDREFRRMTARNLKKRGIDVVQAGGGDEALELLNESSFDVALLDLAMPGISGLELLDEMKSSACDTEVVMLTGEGTIATAVDAMRLGAQDYLTKPVDIEELMVVLEKAYEACQIRKENRQFKALFHRLHRPFNMVGESSSMKELFRLVERAAPTEKPILIQGESGTGKELVAQALHQASKRAEKPFVVINCAALPEHLLESELFGHERGAFTGAHATKPGLFEVADGGTLFIDEIGELAGTLQAKLLRVLEDGSLRRIGSTKLRKVDVRLLSATNRDMAEDVEAGRFREDLYYRIDVMTLMLPTLREREGDIDLLARYFAGPEWHFDPDALRAIEAYHWPGNVRQLINVIDRAKILADDDRIQLKNLPAAIVHRKTPQFSPQRHSPADLLTIQREHIVETIRAEKGNKVRAARALGVSRRTLYRLIDRLGIRDA